jgi:hypothetical protein
MVIIVVIIVVIKNNRYTLGKVHQGVHMLDIITTRWRHITLITNIHMKISIMKIILVIIMSIIMYLLVCIIALLITFKTG